MIITFRATTSNRQLVSPAMVAIHRYSSEWLLREKKQAADVAMQHVRLDRSSARSAEYRWLYVVRQSAAIGAS